MYYTLAQSCFLLIVTWLYYKQTFFTYLIIHFMKDKMHFQSLKTIKVFNMYIKVLSKKTCIWVCFGFPLHRTYFREEFFAGKVKMGITTKHMNVS